MLSKEEIEEINGLRAHYELPKACCVDALKIVQSGHGWVSDEHVVEVAGLLDMSPAQVDGIATFYNMIFRKPVGRHVILICDSVSCWILGYDNLRDHLCEKLGIGLGQTSDDGMFTLIPVPCLGACDHGPAMMIGETLHGDLTREKIDDILASYREKENG